MSGNVEEWVETAGHDSYFQYDCRWPQFTSGLTEWSDMTSKRMTHGGSYQSIQRIQCECYECYPSQEEANENSGTYDACIEARAERPIDDCYSPEYWGHHRQSRDSGGYCRGLELGEDHFHRNPWDRVAMVGFRCVKDPGGST